MDFESIADELYAVPPAEFVAARDAQVALARSAGDRAMSERLRALRKPSTSAWLANLLVRDRPGEIDQLRALGAALRDAQDALAGADLIALSRQRHDVVSALAREALRLAAQRGHRVPGAAGVELEDTLKAALADPAIADELRAGRLTTAQHPDAGDFGAGEPGLHVVPPNPPPRKPRPEAARRRATEALRTAEEAVAREAAELEALRRRRAEVAAELDRVQADASLAERNLERLRAQRDAAEAALRSLTD